MACRCTTGRDTRGDMVTLLPVHGGMRPEQVGRGVWPENKHHSHWEKIRQGPPWEQTPRTSSALSLTVRREAGVTNSKGVARLPMSKKVLS